MATGSAWLPRRRTWPTKTGEEIGRAIAGIAIGFGLSGLVLSHVTILEIVSAGQQLEGGIQDLVFLMFGVPMVGMLLGTMVALVPLVAMMLVERLARVDLGLAAWTLIGLAPTSLASAFLWGWYAGGPAMASGGVAGVVAHTMSRDEEGVRWDVALVAALILIAFMTPVALALPMADPD